MMTPSDSPANLFAKLNEFLAKEPGAIESIKKVRNEVLAELIKKKKDEQPKVEPKSSQFKHKALPAITAFINSANHLSVLITSYEFLANDHVFQFLQAQQNIFTTTYTQTWKNINLLVLQKVMMLLATNPMDQQLELLNDKEAHFLNVLKDDKDYKRAVNAYLALKENLNDPHFCLIWKIVIEKNETGKFKPETAIQDLEAVRLPVPTSLNRLRLIEAMILLTGFYAPKQNLRDFAKVPTANAINLALQNCRNKNELAEAMVYVQKETFNFLREHKSVALGYTGTWKGVVEQGITIATKFGLVFPNRDAFLNWTYATATPLTHQP